VKTVLVCIVLVVIQVIGGGKSDGQSSLAPTAPLQAQTSSATHPALEQIRSDLVALRGTVDYLQEQHRDRDGQLIQQSVELKSRMLDRGDEAILVYDDLVARFGSATELSLREQVVEATKAKLSAQG
jgi:ribosomal 50S subunit-associated protein YjgA (DUF615 family)